MTRKISAREISPSFNKLIQPSLGNRPSIGLDEKIKEYFQIDINSIFPYKKQARKIFNDKEIESLSNTIKLHGIRQPLTVVESDRIGQYEVISGERRLKAAKLAGLEKVPCIVISKKENLEEIALIENIQRSDLHPLELSESYNSLLINYKYGDITNASSRLGISKSHLAEVLSYRNLPDEIKSHLLKNNITSRSVFRALKSCDNISEMKNYLNLDKKNKQAIKVKSILKVLFYNEEIRLEVGKWKMSDEEKIKLKVKLKDFIENI